MSVSIDTITVGSVEDRRMVLTNSQAGRVINIGTSWNTLRVGVRLSVPDTGGTITGTPRLYVGLLASPSAGMANGPLGGTTSHFLGYRSNFATWTRAAGPPVYYLCGSATSNYLVKIVGATVTASGGAQTIVIGSSTTPRRVVFIFEFVKGSPNFTINCVVPTAAPADVVSSSILATAMNNATVDGARSYLTSTVGSNYVGTATGSIAVDEATDGFLNAVCIAWDRITPTMHFSDLMWAKMA